MESKKELNEALRITEEGKKVLLDTIIKKTNDGKIAWGFDNNTIVGTFGDILKFILTSSTLRTYDLKKDAGCGNALIAEVSITGSNFFQELMSHLNIKKWDSTGGRILRILNGEE